MAKDLVEDDGSLEIENLSDIEIEAVSPASDKPLRERLIPGEQLHEDTIGRLIARRDAGDAYIENRREQWRATNNRLRLYVDLTKTHKKGDQTTGVGLAEMPFERSIVVPVSYSILHTLLTQLMSIFGATEPMIQVRGRGPEDVKTSKVMEAVLAYDLEQMSAFKVIYALCQDAVKYGCGITYDAWHTEFGDIVQHKPYNPNDFSQRLQMQMMGPEAFITRTRGLVKEHNVWLPVDPMNYFPDPRVPISCPQDGEFVGHEFNRGLMFLKERAWERGGPYFNIDKIKKKSGLTGDTPVSSDDSMPERTNELIDEKDGGNIKLCHLQVKLIAKEWGLGKSEDPEIWWFTWANDSTIVRAHVAPFDHREFTYAVAESDPDFHSAFNPGMIESIDGLQRMIDWLFNSHLQNLMRHLNDAMIFSPALVEVGDILNPGPGRHIRITQMGEELLMSGGYSIDQFVHQLPVQDVTSPHLAAVNQMFQLAQRMSAANDPQMGMPTPDRRTLGEIQTITASSSQRVSIIAKLIDSMAIGPLARRAIANRLQMTTQEQYYRIVGDDSASDIQYVLANQQNISGNYDYVPISGILPPDPVRMARTWAQILETVSRLVPMLMQGPPPADGKIPDLNAILKESIKTLGAKNIEDFYTQMPQMQTQVMPDQQVQQQEQAGNMVPLQSIDPNNPPPGLV